MSKYLEILPKECKNQTEGVARAVVIEDMLKHGTMFAELDVTENTKSDFLLMHSVADVLESIYSTSERPIVIWNKSLEDNAALFGFNQDNEKVIMLFPMTIPGFKESFLEKVINVKGGNKMAKICPKNGKYVLYLDCKECENRAECEGR